MYGVKNGVCREGDAERPFNLLFWLNELEKSIAGSARDTYVESRACILSMTKWILERQAVTRPAYKHYKPPTYGPYKVKLTEGVPKVLAIEAVDCRPEGNYPIENCRVTSLRVRHMSSLSNLSPSSPHGGNTIPSTRAKSPPLPA